MAFETLTIWHWWVLAGGLLVVELFVSGFFCLWLGASAALTGLVLLGWPAMPMTFQVALFASLSLSCVLAWRQFRQAVAEPSRPAEPTAALVGRRASLLDPIRDGQGRLQLADGTWPVTGPDTPAGAIVEVVGAAGSRLEVRPV